MATIRVGHWQVEFERDLTWALYSRLAHADRARCDCPPCRNFRALGRAAFPEAAHAVLRSLGIEYRQPAEVYVAGPFNDGVVSYGGWFHFVGKLIHEESDHLADLGSGFSYFLHEKVGLVPAVFGQHHVVQLEFYASAPWRLTEPYVEGSHDVV